MARTFLDALRADNPDADWLTEPPFDPADNGWDIIPFTMTAADHHRAAVEDYRAARHAQELRAENYGMGYAEETRAFYGDGRVAACDEAETSLTWKAWLEGSRQTA